MEDRIVVNFYENISNFIKNYNLQFCIHFSNGHHVINNFNNIKKSNIDRFTRFYIKANIHHSFSRELARDIGIYYNLIYNPWSPFQRDFECWEYNPHDKGITIDKKLDISNFRTINILKRRIISKKIIQAIKKTKLDINTSNWLRGSIPEDTIGVICSFLACS